MIIGHEVFRPSPARLYEPVASTRDLSVREMRWCDPRHIKHRFPIKGGIAVSELPCVAQSKLAWSEKRIVVVVHTEKM